MLITTQFFFLNAITTWKNACAEVNITIQLNIYKRKFGLGANTYMHL